MSNSATSFAVVQLLFRISSNARYSFIPTSVLAYVGINVGITYHFTQALDFPLKFISMLVLQRHSSDKVSCL